MFHFEWLLFVAQDFWSHVEGAAANGCCHILWHKRAGEAEVRDLQHGRVALVREEDVLGLEVALEGRRK